MSHSNKTVKPHAPSPTDFATSLLSESLITSKDYLSMHELFRESSFSSDEQEVILYILNHENHCDTCSSAHTNYHEEYSATNPFIPCLMEGKPINDKHINVLLSFLRKIIKNEGQVAAENLILFLKEGFTQKNVMELITAHAMQSIKNYTFHIGETAL